MDLVFSDLQNHFARECIIKLAEQKIVSGYPDGRFQPNATMTRAEFAAVLNEAFPQVEKAKSAAYFRDVPENHWAYSAIQSAYQREFFIGYPDGSFRPSQTLPRVQATVVLANGLEYSFPKQPDEILRLYFDDAGQIPSYAKNAVAAATLGSLVVNYPQIRQFQPNQSATRGEVSALLCQGLNIANTIAPQYIAGNFVIQPQFDYAKSFSDGMAWVKIGRKWGAVDKTGKLVISPQYYEHYPFSEGLALVTIGGKYRYLDKQGNIAIQIPIDGAAPFSEGLAWVKVGEKYGFINSKGQFIIPPRFDSVGSFSEGLAWVKINSDYGFIDKTGRFVIEPPLGAVFSFYDGRAWTGKDGKNGFIDRTGNFTAIDFTLSDAPGKFSEGLARVSTGGDDAFIDSSGKLVTRKFDYALDFSQGLSAVFIDRKWGYIDKTGKFVIEPQFEQADSFSQGLAVVKTGNKWGYIDRTGKFVIEPKFDEARSFSQELAAVRVGSQWGYIVNPLQ